MNRRILALASLCAVAGMVILALFLTGVFDGGDAAEPGSEAAARCPEDNLDCDDTLDLTDSAGDDGDGASSAPVCAPGFPDCVDTVVVGNDDPDGGEGRVIGEPLCDPDAPDCTDMIVDEPIGGFDDDDAAEPPADPLVPASGECSGDAFESCEQQAINAVLADAEAQFGVDESEIDVESAAFQEWSNACLDAATPGEACAEVITPGFVIVISLGDSHYEYHTDLNGNVRLAP